MSFDLVSFLVLKSYHRGREYSKGRERYLFFFISFTANSGIFARVLLRETSRMRSFVKIKPSRNGEITLSFTNVHVHVGKSCPSVRVFNAIRSTQRVTIFSDLGPELQCLLRVKEDIS